MGSKLQRQDVEEPGISSPDTLKVRVELALSRSIEANRSIGSSHDKPSYHKVLFPFDREKSGTL